MVSNNTHPIVVVVVVVVVAVAMLVQGLYYLTMLQDALMALLGAVYGQRYVTMCLTTY